MAIDIKRNLDFQKRYFPEIHACYLDKLNNEVALTILKEPKEYTEEKYIQIVSDDISNIVTRIFKIPSYLLNQFEIDDIEEIHLIKDIHESIESFGRILEIKYPYPYVLSIDKVIVSNKVKKEVSINRMKIYILKNLSIFEKNYLKNSQFKIENLSDTNQLEKCLINFKPTYKIKHLIIQNSKKNQNEDKTIRTTDEYKNIIIGNLVKIVLNSKEDNAKITVKKLIKYIVKEYENESVKIVKNFMTDNFLKNFKIVQICINNKEKFLEHLDDKYLNEIESYIEEIRKNEKSKQLALLLDGKVKELDKILSNTLSYLMNDVKIMGDEY
jgi:hypothetical protein